MEIELRLLLAALATYRLAQLVALDDGPFGVFARLRCWATGHTSDRVRELVGGLVTCPYCVGVYMALLCAVLALWPTTIGDLALTIVGLAGAQAWLQGGREAGD